MNYRLSESQRKEIFFFAELESSLYDPTIPCVDPLYFEAHAMLIQLLKYHFLSYPTTSHCKILDIGFGTGVESIGILREFPDINLVGIDLSKSMADIFVAKCNNAIPPIESTRYKLLIEDFLNAEVIPELLGAFEVDLYRVIVSAYTIHHFTFEEKQIAFKNIYDLLEPGGIFINLDLFNYNSSDMSRLANDFEINYIRKEFDKFNEKGELPSEKILKLRSKWIKHYNNHNILHSVEKEIEMMKELNFSILENPFRYWQGGIIWAQK